jgi:hypothetical protein
MIRTFRLVLIVGLVVAAPTARAVVIDDFTVAPIALTESMGPGSESAVQTGLDPAHVAGGVRSWFYDVRAQFNIDPPATAAIRTGVRLDPSAHMYYDADDGLTAINFALRYNAGATSTSQPGLNLDLAALRHNALAIDFNYALFDDDNGYMDIVAGQYKYTRVVNSATPFRLVHPFAATPDAGSGILKSVTLGTSNGYLFGAFELNRVSTISTADFNADGAVDGADFLVWQQNVGATTTGGNAARIALGDANLNGVVDGADLALWRGMLSVDGGAPADSAAAAALAAVPEPSSLLVAATGLLLLAGRRPARRPLAPRGA